MNIATGIEKNLIEGWEELIECSPEIIAFGNATLACDIGRHKKGDILLQVAINLEASNVELFVADGDSDIHDIKLILA